MLTNDKPKPKNALIGNILILLLGSVLGISSILKFVRVPAVVHQMAMSGFTDGKLMLVAALEILSSLLFLYPRTRSFGLLFLSAFLGGAICTHVQLGEFSKAMGPAFLLALAWTGTFLRYPSALWSLKDNSALAMRGENSGARLASREA